MKIFRKTFISLAVAVFSAAIALFLLSVAGAACSNKVTLRFETGEGSRVAPVEGGVGLAYERPAEPTKDGCFFEGWYLTPDCEGEKQSLPEVMPSESRTYYAKYVRYPAVALDLNGGTLREETILIKPGENILGQMQNHVPQREGLTFGGWYLGGEPLGEDAVMTDEDISLTARYLADYTVNVFLQLPDRPLEYEMSGPLSYRGSDWEGELLKTSVLPPDHFEGDGVRERVLQAGENVVNLFFTRETLRCTYDVALPTGGGDRQTVESRYGARLRLPSPASPEGYAFFGWAEEQNGETVYWGDGAIELTRDLDLYGSWAKTYPCARGEGSLAVSCGEHGGVREVVYTDEGGTRRGTLSDGLFEAEGVRGKLDGHGCFLPDDSGTYAGESLQRGEVSAEKYGALVLDFPRGEARLLLGGESKEGRYTYEYDPASRRYTGDYLFEGEDGFRFRLKEGSFLREGEEKGSYIRADRMTGEVFGGETLELDGFGGAVLGGRACVYRGEGEAWALADGTLTFLLGGREWSADGGVLLREPVFLRYERSRAGSYRAGEDLLELDGYGICARLVEGGRETVAPFTAEGRFVTLLTEPSVTFTLQGGAFARTGAEAGAYEGARGTLLLDGAGGALLAGKECAYAPAGGEWSLVGEELRFRLAGGRYEVYDPSLAGEFATYYGKCLVLDGYGGGIYYDCKGVPEEISLGYADGEYLEVCSPSFVTRTRSLTFRVRGDRVTQQLFEEAGSYLRCEEEGEGSLFLSGDGLAVLAGKKCEYRLEEGGVRIEEEGLAISLFERGGSACFSVSGGKSYEGSAGALVLDGLGGARFEGAFYRCAAEGNFAELFAEGRRYRFLLGDGTYEMKRYLVYGGETGELLLEEDGTEAILIGEEEKRGTYSSDGGILRLLGGAYRLYGSAFYACDESAIAVYAADGETLSLDGCGFAVYQADERYFGTIAEVEEGIFAFGCGSLSSRSGMVGFRIAEGTFLRLGGEFGRYAVKGGGSLWLYGNGSARLDGGEILSCETLGENELLLGGSLRVRLGEDGSCELRNEALAQLGGEYACGEDTLLIDGYRVCFASDGRTLTFLRVAEGGFFASDGEGRLCFIALRGENAELFFASCTLTVSEPT